MSKQAKVTRPANGLVHEIDVEVRYAETDQMGVVHHANYLVWFELARTALCERSGTSYPEIEEMGYWLMVTGVHLDYRAGAKYGDTVRVGAWIEKIGSRVMHFGYDTHRIEQGQPASLLARGVTEHTWVNAESGRVCRVSDALQSGFRKLNDQGAD